MPTSEKTSLKRYAQERLIQLVIFGGPLAIAAYIGNANLYSWDAKNRRAEIQFQQDQSARQIQQEAWMDLHNELALAGQLIRHENMPIPSDLKDEINHYFGGKQYQQSLEYNRSIVTLDDGTVETRPPNKAGLPQIDWSKYYIPETPFDIALLKIKFHCSKAIQLGQVYRDENFLSAVKNLQIWVALVSRGEGWDRQDFDSLPHEDCLRYLNQSLADLLIRIRIPDFQGQRVPHPDVALSFDELDFIAPRKVTKGQMMDELIFEEE